MTAPNPPLRPRRRKRFDWRVWLWPAILAALTVGMWLTPWRDMVPPMREWVEMRGAAAWAWFVVAYAVVVMLPLPAVAMSFVGGLVFGLWGYPLSLAGSLIGALPPYLIGRHWLREPVKRRIGHGKVAAADRAMSDNPALFVVLLRITPVVPLTLQNWLLGLTGVRTWPYVWATVAGLALPTLAVVWLGALGGFAALGTSPGTLWAMTVGLGLLVLLIGWLTLRALAALRASGWR